MTTEQVGRFRCEACNINFDSMRGLLKHNVEQPPGIMPDEVPADLQNKGD
jgi:hypothetical protein